MAKVKDKENVVYFRYKLNDNTNNARMGIEGVKLTKDGWHDSRERIMKMDKWVKTDINPKGIVTLEMFNPYDGKGTIITTDKQVYSIEDLIKMDRKAVAHVCKLWGIKSERMNKERLVKSLLIKFDEVKEEVKSPVTETEEVVEESAPEVIEEASVDAVIESPTEEEAVAETLAEPEIIEPPVEEKEVLKKTSAKRKSKKTKKEE